MGNQNQKEINMVIRLQNYTFFSYGRRPLENSEYQFYELYKPDKLYKLYELYERIVVTLPLF